MDTFVLLAFLLPIAGAACISFLREKHQEKIARKEEERKRHSEEEKLGKLIDGIAELYKRYVSLDNFDSGYLMKKDWDAFCASAGSALGPLESISEDVLSAHPLSKQVSDLRAAVSNPHYRSQRNDRFEKEELAVCDSLLSDIGGCSLDRQQRNAVITDEYSNLVIAGAGSGKSTTVVGKVKYLVQHRHVKPEEILVTSFTRASVSDLEGKIEDAGIEGVAAKTFHKIGLEILGQVKVANEYSLAKCIKGYLEKTLAENPKQAAAFVEFFGLRHLAECGNSAEVSAEERMSLLKAADLKTLKGLIEGPDDGLETWQGEKVKSVEELLIANFLFLNGIEYEYEKGYTAEIPRDLKDGGRRAYQPDFYLAEYDIWLEHFGINQNGRPSWIKDPVEQQKYVDAIKWKREVHKRCGTRLIESYSYWNADQNLLNNVKALLVSNGVVLNNDPERNAANCRKLLRDKSFCRSISQLLGTFISLAKSSKETVEEIEDQAREAYRGNGAMWQRFELFMAFTRPIMEEYSKTLRSNNEVDFDDMIGLAADKVKVEGLEKSYRYIIVDEYQDISKSRLDLILAIREKADAKLICVGDDWQSIYRFAGSDVTLFTNFGKIVGYHEELKIEHTYRNSQQLVDVASRFVLKNTDQLSKTMIASPERSVANPISISAASNMRDGFLFALNRILDLPGNGGKITVLGRNRADLDKLFPDDGSCKTIRIEHSSKNRHEDTGSADAVLHYAPDGTGEEHKIEYKTVHKSKGLEADNVIVLNLVNNAYGFPNMIEDDAILSLLLADSDDYPFAEERRLFYVAITRTKNHVWLITPDESDRCGQSRFVTELRAENHSCIDYYSTDSEADVSRCPRCGGILMVRTSSSGQREFVGCSNYPLCDMVYADPRIIEDNIRCPRCGGYMVRRTNKDGKEFFGCTNYPKYCTYAFDPSTQNRPGQTCIHEFPALEKDDSRLPTSDGIHSLIKREKPQRSGLTCRRCGAELVLRESPKGKFYGCSNYPSCTYTLDFSRIEPHKTSYTRSGKKKAASTNSPKPKCPICGGSMVIRHGPNGKFYGCRSYPKCKGTRSIK